MAGGIGSRFWPASTSQRPKQFLDILGIGKSLIRMTFERCLKLVPAENVLVLTNERYRDLVKEHLPELNDQNILGEPSMNNTAPCIAWTALHLNAKNENASFAVLPSDHVILKEDQYVQKLEQAFAFSENENGLVTLGIQPSRPDTGYGYIETNPDQESESILKVKSFKEKPNRALAQQYLDAGCFYWNAGMFIWSVKNILDSFAQNAPQILEVLNAKPEKFGAAGEIEYINEVYPNTENISVDYAILERAQNVYTIPSDIGWSDLGTWSSLYDFIDKDNNSCAVIGDKTFLQDTQNTIVHSDSKKVVVIKGLSDYIVVDEPDALLIYPKTDEQEIKAVVKKLLQ